MAIVVPNIIKLHKGSITEEIHRDSNLEPVFVLNQSQINCYKAVLNHLTANDAKS